MDQTSHPIHTDDLPWMPLSPGIAVRPLRLVGDERTLQLKVEPGVCVGRHRHTGAVHAFNVSGSRRLGTGEIAGPGAYVYEPAGNEDCWSCVGESPVVVQITLSGRVIDLDDRGETVGYTDTPKLRELYRAWCVKENISPAALGAE